MAWRTVSRSLHSHRIPRRPLLASGNHRYLSNGKSDEPSDLELHQSHSGLINRLFALVDPEATKATKALGDHCPTGWRGLLLRSDLQNPLLKRYNFDAVDFTVGVQHAIQEIKAAFSAREICDMRASGIVKHTPQADFLRDVLCKHLFEAVSRPLAAGESDYASSAISISDLTLCRVQTVIVDQAFINHRHNIGELANMLRKFGRNLMVGKRNGQPLNEDDAVEVDDLVANPDGTVAAGLAEGNGNHYPIGSVLVTVDVQFVTEEEAYLYNKISLQNELIVVDDKDNKIKRTYGEKWTFEACVSGQVDEHWIVSHFHIVTKVVKKLL